MAAGHCKETRDEVEDAEEEADAGLTRFRRFLFTDDEDEKAELLVTIPEVLDPRYGMFVWPCAVVLAQLVWHERARVSGQRVLELGAGTALPGVVAARCGARFVWLCDAPRCLAGAARSRRLNAVCGATRLAGLRWGLVTPSLVAAMAPVDIVLGSDVLYEPRDFEAVLATVFYLLNKNPHAEFWTTYQERSAEWSLEVLLLKWGLGCRLLDSGSFGGDSPCLAGSSLPGDHSVLTCVITLLPRSAA